MRKLSLTFLLLITTVAISVSATSNSNPSKERPIYEIHSMMIYNFVKYIQWPGDAADTFVIGVIGDDEVFNTLNTWYNGKVRGNKKFIIKKFNSPSEITECQMLYVAKEESDKFSTIKSYVNTSSTLIITDKPGLGQKGSGINFKTINDKLVFELNESVLANSNLKVSSQLTAMAIVI